MAKITRPVTFESEVLPALGLGRAWFTFYPPPAKPDDRSKKSPDAREDAGLLHLGRLDGPRTDPLDDH
jgi:hypothetical protein